MPGDEPHDHLLDAGELDAWIEADDAADRAAAELLREALADFRGQPPPPEEVREAAAVLRAGLAEGGHPFDWLRRGAGLGDAPPDDDVELVIQCTLASMLPIEQTGLDSEEESLLVSMERADWLGSVIQLVREGPGSSAEPADLVRAVGACPEIETPADWDPDDDTLLETTFELVALPWYAIGLTDKPRRLTALGAWVLPRALARGWGMELDEGG